MLPQTITGSDRVSIELAVSDADLGLTCRFPSPLDRPQNMFVAIRTGCEIGAAVLPFAQHAEGSTVFLTFKADRLIAVEIRGTNANCFIRRWERWRWSDRATTETFGANIRDGTVSVWIPRTLLGNADSFDFVTYTKNTTANHGWGWFWGCSDQSVNSGTGDKYIAHYHEVRFGDEPVLTLRSRAGAGENRVRIYQLFVRLFGNTNETRKRNGTLTENGVGKFADINDAALESIRAMGFTHVWLTGVLQQATATDYSEFGQPADDTDLLKGLAGSPYAIKDYFDVCPDYAINPDERLKEFRELIERLHGHGLKAIIDLVPNHVARSYGSCVRPDCDFGVCGCAGAGDDTTKFFHPHNNFFYLTPD